jgi:hypothetical protein
MPTREELILQFMLALASNSSFDYKSGDYTFVSPILDEAKDLADEYLKVV